MDRQIPKYEETVSWLLESGISEIQYLTKTQLLGISPEKTECKTLRQQSYENGYIAQVLSAMQPEGYWEKPGPGYLPKYKSAVWSLLLLAQLGAKADHDPRIKTACDYLCAHALTDAGQFTTKGTPSTTIDCLQGNMCWALSLLEYDSPALCKAFDWMARSITGEGLAPNTEKNAPNRYYAYQCGPAFRCGANYTLACAWGGIKSMKAISLLPETERNPLIQAAIQTGLDFFFSIDPASAEYPYAEAKKPSRNWWKFGFPLFYVSDLLEIAEFMAAFGLLNDPRLGNLIDLILSKQDESGRWPLEYHYNGKTWGDYGRKGKPSPWVTYRVLKVFNT